MKKEHLIIGAIAIVGGYLAYKHFKKEAKTCTCKNGFTGTCYSGDCSACCGKYGFEGKRGFGGNVVEREAPYKRFATHQF